MRFRAAALPLCLMLTLAACGARLTNAERLAGIRSLDRGNGSQVGAQAGTKSGVNVGPTFGPGGSNGAFGPDAYSSSRAMPATAFTASWRAVLLSPWTRRMARS